MKKYSGQIRLRMPKALHCFLVEEANKQGVSLNQYMVYLLARGNENVKLSRIEIKIQKTRTE